jgi:hypothetical protein
MDADRTVAGDIFSYISSMTRDNPHMNLPDGESAMSGSERAAKRLSPRNVHTSHVA